MPKMPAWVRGLLAGLGLLCAAAPALAASANTSDLVSRDRFRVCADPSNLPFTNEAGEGF